MTGDLRKRRSWQIYTLRNIRSELISRLSPRTQLRGAPRTVATGDSDTHAAGVARFYDAHHEQFMRVYGEVIQAFRTRDVTDLLDHQLRSIAFQPGQRALDAGCGVAAPAIYFARHAGVHIDCITISGAQCNAARQRVADAGLTATIRVVHGDYHRLADYFQTGSYDVLYFLESFGHSRAKAHLLGVCWDMLKPGGVLYIKDLFRRLPLRAEHAAPIDREIRRIDEAYHYEVGDLNAVLDALRGRGFILDSLRSVRLDLERFEDLAISNEFQELTGIARIENWSEYVFPVDFFEIRAVKPEFDVEERLDRHFLQVRLHAGESPA